MDYIHDRKYLNSGDSVIVQCSHRCNVRVMDDINYQLFQSGRDHYCHGGYYERFPVRITVPSAGHWNVTLDLGGGRANIRYNIGYMTR